MSLKIDLKIFLFIIIFYFTKQIEIYAMLMIFAFIHELGHLICGLVLGFKPISLKIIPVGFQICFHTNLDNYHKKVKNGTEMCVKKALVALAGPFVNLLVAFIGLIISFKVGKYVEYIIYANLLIAIFNLLPIYPLDGGRILKEIIHIYKGRETSLDTTNYVSKITVIFLTIIESVIILYIHNIAILLVLAYLWYLVIKNEKIYKIKKNIYEQVANMRNNENLIRQVKS